MKNLLTMLLIVALAFAFGTASAGEMTYKLYGKLHTSLNYASNGDQSALTMTSNTSRFGVKGGVELNENFTAIYQVESSLNIAQRGGTLASRNTFLGLKGKWGTLLAGIHDTPFKTLGRKITFFKDQIGDFRTMTVGYDMRLNDVVLYATPKNDMWGGQLMYQLDQNDWTVEDNEAATAFSGMAYVTPMEGDLFVGAAYENWSKGYLVPTETDGVKSTSAFRGAAKYMGEKFAVSGLFQSVSDWYTVEGVDATTFGLEALFMAAEKWHLKGNYYMTTIKPEGEEDIKWSQFAVGVDHVFAPRTVLYLQLAMVSQGDNGFGGIGGNSVDAGTPWGEIDWSNGFGGYYAPALNDAGDEFENPMAISVGAIHTF